MDKIWTFNNNIVKYGNDAMVTAAPSTAYKRYMWRWDGLQGDYGLNIFQMGAIKINGINLPYDYISYNSSSSWFGSNQEPYRMLESMSGDDPYHKWCQIGNDYNNAWGWIIFDLPVAVVPTTYSLQTGGDTGVVPERNPRRVRLYGSTGTPTGDSDPSWVLLSDYSGNFPAANYYWFDAWSDPID